MRAILNTFILICLVLPMRLLGQCANYQDDSLSVKVASYDIEVSLDNDEKTAHCTQNIRWLNTSPDTVFELRFYMYMNAFKNTESSFIKRSNANVFGQDIYNRKPEEWGYIEVNSIMADKKEDLIRGMHYIQPNFPDSLDESVLRVPLNKGIAPGEEASFNMDFTVKMPLLMARSGYSLADYYLFVHWFPQLGVYEANEEGKWGWNCHQFVPGTEFYADFGNFKVTLDLPEHLTVGATGCRINEKRENGRQILTFLAYDVIDFAWVVYARFEEYYSNYKDVEIRLLIPPEHCGHADRMLLAARQTLEYLDEHVGPYPYPRITVIDPPLHALRSGLMEYPMLITCGSFYSFPKQVRSLESLVVHELTHMYFMAIIATNEKEEAWMDEGFVTYFEDQIMDHYYGEKESLFNVFGFKSGNKENSRIEYVSMDNPRHGIIGRPGWEFDGYYKELIYAKTATTFQTLRGMIGDELMDQLMQAYFGKFKFTHPRGSEFIDFASDFVGQRSTDIRKSDIQSLFQQAIYTNKVCDYKVQQIRNMGIRPPRGYFTGSDGNVFSESQEPTTYKTEIVLERLGDFVLPVDVRIRLKNGKEIWKKWDGKKQYHTITLREDAPTQSVYIDPEHKIYLDLDFHNNSLTLNGEKRPSTKYASKAIQWAQNILQAATLIF